MKNGLVKSTKPRALIVDDSYTVQRHIRVALSSLELDLDFATNSKDAFTKIEEIDYDIVFLDVMLPGGMDGYSICKQIKNSKRTKRIPVIMLTSKDTSFDKVRGMMSGSNVYLTKPVNSKKLLEAVEKVAPSVCQSSSNQFNRLRTGTF
ncbi:MAG: response regulator [Gammaproteobacteria bacterium]|nr:response regulator [Gammaproteobacteria bacterium]MDH5801614.1 response regulator [Gammaproteobacteria bacterium]